MKKKFIILLFGLVLGLGLVLFIAPFVVSAQLPPNPPNPPSGGSGGPTLAACSLETKPNVGDLLSYVTCIISQSVLPLIFALAIAMFVWGVVQYVIGANEEKEREKGKQFMIWGIVALAVMVSVWGLVRIVTNTFGVNNRGFIPHLIQCGDKPC